MNFLVLTQATPQKKTILVNMDTVTQIHQGEQKCSVLYFNFAVDTECGPYFEEVKESLSKIDTMIVDLINNKQD